jgi:hypothetical protein
MTITKQKMLFETYNESSPKPAEIGSFSVIQMANHVNFDHGSSVIPGLDDFDTDIIIDKFQAGEISQCHRDRYLQSVSNYKLKRLREILQSKQINIAYFTNAENFLQRYSYIPYVNTKIVQLRKLISSLPTPKLEEYNDDRSDNPHFRIMDREDLLWYDKESDNFSKKPLFAGDIF